MAVAFIGKNDTAFNYLVEVTTYGKYTLQQQLFN